MGLEKLRKAMLGGLLDTSENAGVNTSVSLFLNIINKGDDRMFPLHFR